MALLQKIFFIVEMLAIGNSLVVGSFLVIRSKRSKPTFLLGILLFISVVQLSLGTLKALNVWQQMHFLRALPLLSTLWFHFPIFFYYTYSVSAFEKKGRPYWMFFPGIFFSFMILASNFFTDASVQDLSQKLDVFSFILAHFYGLFIAYLNIRFINGHRNRVGNYFSSVQGKELKWAKTFLYVNIGVVILSFFMITMVDRHNYLLRLPYVIILLFYVIWLSWHGTKQYNVASIMDNLGDYGLVQKSNLITTKREEVESSKELGSIMVKVEDLFCENEPYSNPELNIVDVAVSINVHPKKLSKAINNFTGNNFNRYINKYRVEKAKELLKDTSRQDMTIYGLGKEAGFQSKSAFYSAFKSFVGITPLEYQKS
ncbi:MAG: helix-turn-helix domain-containing protein [Bacteroidota bacterium]